MTVISDKLQKLIGVELDAKSEANGDKPLSGGTCNKDSCSCTGYARGDAPGTCGCGHPAYEHV